jgi:uncharacterized membrane protein
MKLKTVKLVEWITCVILPAVLAITFIYDLWYLPLIFLFLAAVMFGVMISRLKEVYQDELTKAIEDKGASAALSIGTILMIIAGVVLLGISKDHTSDMGIAALTIFASSYGLSLINLFTKMYYRVKLGAK